MKPIFSKEKLQKCFIDTLFPEYNTCHLCGCFDDQTGILCSRCAEDLRTMQYKKLHVASPEAHEPLKICLSAFPHRDGARELVHLLKYQSDCKVAELLGESMAAALAISPLALKHIDAVVPVPLHADRLEQRGYNQALLLAQGVCRHTGLRLMDGALIRLHATDTQLHRDRAQRMEAMRHAFAVSAPQAVRSLHVLLVDDVLTTGATAVSCAHALLAAGAASVSLLTVCRA